MTLTTLCLGLGPIVMLPTSLTFDWLALRTYNKYAAIVGIEIAKGNVFTMQTAIGKRRKNVLSSSTRRKIVGFQIASAASTLGFMALMIFSIRHK